MTIHDKIAADIAPLGGFLRCTVCGSEQRLGEVARHLSTGWPRCCGYTMRWWTQRQIDAGEVIPPDDYPSRKGSEVTR